MQKRFNEELGELNVDLLEWG